LRKIGDVLYEMLLSFIDLPTARPSLGDEREILKLGANETGDEIKT
jgi:hypothetical protein